MLYRRHIITNYIQFQKRNTLTSCWGEKELLTISSKVIVKVAIANRFLNKGKIREKWLQREVPACSPLTC